MRNSQRIAASTGAAFAVLAILVVTEWSPLRELDHGFVGPANDLAREHDTYRHLMTGTTWALNSQVILGFVGIGALALIGRGRRGTALWLAVVVGTGTVLNPVLKAIFGRDRPTVPDPIDTFNGLSFPSGHANSAALICAAVVTLFWREFTPMGRRLAVLVVVAVPLLSGWTRMTLGAHYVSDVVGGFLFGVAWVALWQPALPRLQRRSPPRVEATEGQG